MAGFHGFVGRQLTVTIGLLNTSPVVISLRAHLLGVRKPGLKIALNFISKN
jgi:hypothetical protein